MHANPAIPTSVLYGFLLVLARISGVFVFLPLPGLQAGPSAAKITLAMILTLGMYSRWPVLNQIPASMLQVAGWMLAEAAIGLATGLAVAYLIEAVTFAASVRYDRNNVQCALISERCFAGPCVSDSCFSE